MGSWILCTHLCNLMDEVIMDYIRTQKYAERDDDFDRRQFNFDIITPVIKHQLQMQIGKYGKEKIEQRD